MEEIPDSVLLGDDSLGIAIAFGEGPVPTQLELIGLGQSYSVGILGYDSSGEFGNTVTGTLAIGQTQTVPLSMSSSRPSPPISCPEMTVAFWETVRGSPT